MAGILGWKDILRPIRDGYRHLFPAPDTGPSPEERRKRRDLDRLKGFAYFDTFEQLENWDVNASDPLQRANSPLLLRCVDRTSAQDKKANVLLCHDYAGNYHDYESVQELGQNEEMYNCEYLQNIDTFVYFSHKLVCVPPPTWINTLHRNGIKALGTILVEPQTKDTARLLQRTVTGDDMKFILARTLADIAKHYGFDGYLVNIEKPFPRDDWTLEALQAFLVQLRANLGEQMQLIWYDALTMSNEVQYQNGLTNSNICFAEACGNILTNYCWDGPQASKSKKVALESGFPSENVYFGIDVWAQNYYGLTNPRTTYPKKGGGGTNTGVAVAKLAELGFSAGIFGPAWSFEHFPGRGRELERVIWEGQPLPADIDCSCGNLLSRHQQTQGSAIVQHARLFPAGSKSFFYTDFSRAFAFHTGQEGQDREIRDNNALLSQLGVQSIIPLPSPPLHPCGLTHTVESSTRQSKLIITAHGNLTSKKYWLPLHNLNMSAIGGLRIVITCRTLQPLTGDLGVYLKFSNCHEPQLLPVDKIEHVHTIEAIVSASSQPPSQVQELGIYSDHLSGSDQTTPVLEIHSISITVSRHNKTPATQTIHNVRIVSCGEGENKHVRLSWEYGDRDALGTHGMPYSEITGPFSHFDLEIDGSAAGRCYALECILSKDVAEMLGTKEVDMKIKGIGFDGQTLACQTTILGTKTGNAA